MRKDPHWDLMRKLNVPLHMLTFEKRVESERQRRFEESGGQLNYEDIAINLMDFDERGNSTEFFESNTIMSQIPFVGMFERQMSLQHDLLMIYLIKNQLSFNHHFKMLASQPNGIELLAKDESVKQMVNFISLSMGDFQYTTNEKFDAIAGRIGKVVFAAPRWYASNLALNPLVNLAVSFAYNNIPAVKKALGPNVRTLNVLSTKNRQLLAYQVYTYLGTVGFWWLLQHAIEWIGYKLGRPDVTGDPYKAGAFRILNWRVAESTGTLDAWNTFNQANFAYLKGKTETMPKPGMTLEETNSAFLGETAQRLGYKLSPLISRMKTLITGRDVIGRAVYRPDYEMIQGVDELYKSSTPFLKMLGLNVPETIEGKEIPLTSVLISGHAPASWQDAWQAYSKGLYFSSNDRDVSRAIGFQQFIASFLGTQVKFDKFVPDAAQQLYRQQMLFKRMSDQGPTGYEVLNGGPKKAYRYVLYGKE